MRDKCMFENPATRIEALALQLDRLDPEWPTLIDLDDDDPVLDQLHWWVNVEPERSDDYGVEVLAFAVAEREVFSPWGERQWRKAVRARQGLTAVERLLRARLPTPKERQ